MKDCRKPVGVRSAPETRDFRFPDKWALARWTRKPAKKPPKYDSLFFRENCSFVCFYPVLTYVRLLSFSLSFFFFPPICLPSSPIFYCLPSLIADLISLLKPLPLLILPPPFQAAPLFLGGPRPSDLLTVQLPFDRHVDVFHQLKHQIPTLMKERSREAKLEPTETLEQRLLHGPDYTPETAPIVAENAPSGE